MKIKWILVLSLLVVLLGGMDEAHALWGFGEDGKIGGQVVDADVTSSGLGDVQVVLEETSTTANTDEFGEFRFKDLASGSYTVTFKKVGYLRKTVQVQVESGKSAQINVPLKKGVIYSASKWAEVASEQFHNTMERLKLRNKRILVAFYKINPNDKCPLPELVLRFSNVFNSNLGNSENQIVIRDKHQASLIAGELKSQHQFKGDFDPATIAKIGKKYGANMVVMGDLIEKREFFEPLISGTDVETETMIPGLSIREVLLKKDDLRCE